jgi:ABC-type Fe3+/spermidine/putrescine transport system ATPase subunit
MLQLDGLSKSFGANPVLADFSLTVEAGERFMLLGRSGCGKTTLLRLIAGFVAPERGRIRIDGRDVTDLPVERRPVGFIFQNHALFPHLTVYDNIAVGPRIRKMAEGDIRSRMEELLAVLGLRELRAAYPGRISGGESQRVALARAIINRPKVLLLDEPLSALDQGLRQRLRDELVEMQRLFGITFLFVTHDQEEAMSLATRMGVLERGRLLQTGSPAELYDRPADAFIADFLGETNRFSGVVCWRSGRRVTVEVSALGQLICDADDALTEGTRVVCFVRPEKVFLTATQPADAGSNCFAGTPMECAFFGDHARVRVRLANGTEVRVRTAPAVALGERVWVVFSAADVSVFADTAAVNMRGSAL